jgi:hypothetical protein
MGFLIKESHRGTEVTEKIKKLVFKVPSIKRGFRDVFNTAVHKPFMQCSPRNSVLRVNSK